MKLLWHIVQSDGRRLRWPLAGWLGFLGVKLGLGFWVIWGGKIELETFRRLEIITGLFVPCEVLLAFLLTARLVQGDGLVGSRQFWLTRPISGGRLLAAKALGAMVLLVAPAVALAVPWWLVCGLDAPLLLAAAVDAVCWLGLAILPAFLLASLTDSLGRFLLWSVVALWSGAMAIFYAQWLWVKVAGGGEGSVGNPTTDQLWIMALGMSLVIVGVVARQYRTRDLLGSVLWLALGSLAALALGTIGMGSAETTAAVSRGVTEGAGAAAAPVRLEWVGGTVQNRTPDSTREAWVDLRLRAAGWPVHLDLWGGAASLTWQWAGGPEYRKSGYSNTQAWRTQSLHHAFGFTELPADAETERWLREQAAKKRRLPPPAPTGSRLRVETSRDDSPGPGKTTEGATGGIISVHSGLPRSLAARAQQENTRLRLKLDLSLRQSMPRLETTLRPGGWRAGSGMGLRVMEVAPQSRAGANGSGRQRDLKEVRTVESYVAFTTGPGERLAVHLTGRDFTWWRWGAPRRLAVNRQYGLGEVAYYTGSPLLRIASVALRAEYFSVGAPMVVRDGQWVKKHPDWFDSAALFSVDWATVERFSREVEVGSVFPGR